MTDDIRRPRLPAGWSWHTVERTVRQVVNGELRAFPKVYIELFDPNGNTARHATIDVGIYGSTTAVEERIRHMYVAEFGGDA